MSWHPARTTLVLAALVAALAAGLALPGPAAAEKRGAFEVSAQFGYRFQGRLEGRTDSSTGENLGDVYFSGGLDYGATLGYWINRNVMIEGAWTGQSTDLENRDPPDGEEATSTGVGVNDFLVGFAVHGGRAYDRLRWWGGAHLGGTTFGVDEGKETRFSMAFSVGTRSPLSARVRLRTYARLRTTYLDRSQDLYCSAPDACYSFPRSNWLNQWDVGAGVHYLF